MPASDPDALGSETISEEDLGRDCFSLGHPGSRAMGIFPVVKAAGMPCGLFWQWQEVEGCFHWRML